MIEIGNVKEKEEDFFECISQKNTLPLTLFDKNIIVKGGIATLGYSPLTVNHLKILQYRLVYNPKSDIAFQE